MGRGEEGSRGWFAEAGVENRWESARFSRCVGVMGERSSKDEFVVDRKRCVIIVRPPGRGNTERDWRF
jgi:hypothetical protein